MLTGDCKRSSIPGMATETDTDTQLAFRLPASLRQQLRREADSIRRPEAWLLREILAERYETARDQVAPIVSD